MKIILFLFFSLALSSNDLITPAKEGFINVNRLLPSMRFDIRYATHENFLGTPVEGYDAPLCYLTKEAGYALKEVQNALEKEGLRLQVFDCYRPQRSVDHFVRWAKDINDTTMKKEYYPGVEKRELFEKGYIAARSGHSRGSTVDLTIEELDMGTPFDFFDPRSHTASDAVTKEQHANRMMLKKVMEENGFQNYAEEWWHYTLKDEPFTTTYFDFTVSP